MAIVVKYLQEISVNIIIGSYLQASRFLNIIIYIEAHRTKYSTSCRCADFNHSVSIRPNKINFFAIASSLPIK